jgi:hypothetical protein
MDVDRLTVDKQKKLMKEGRCFKCRNTGHQANKCPEENDDKKEGKEVPKKKMNGRELHAHVRALFKEMTGRWGWVFEGCWRSGFLKRRAASTSVSPYLDIYSVTIANISWNSIFVPINIGLSKQTVETLIDSSAGGLFIDQNFAKNFDIKYLDKPVKAYNMDGMENKRGTINAYINLEFTLGEQKFKERFYVTGLGKQRIILGFPWLHKYNLIIDWKKGEITFKPFWINWRRLMEKGKQIWQEQQPKIEEVVDDKETKNWMTLLLEKNKMGVYIELLETDVWINKTNIATELAIEENSKKTDKMDE